MHRRQGRGFKEALSAEFKEYPQAELRNARTFCSVLSSAGYDIVTGRTDTPLVMVDLRSLGLIGDVAAESLEAARIPCNKKSAKDRGELLAWRYLIHPRA